MTVSAKQLTITTTPFPSSINIPSNSPDSPLVSTPDNDWGYQPTIKTQHSYLETRRSSQDSTSTTISQMIGTKQSWENNVEAVAINPSNGKSRKARKETQVHGSWYTQTTTKHPAAFISPDLIASERIQYVFESAGQQLHASWYTHRAKLSSSERVDLDYKYFSSVRQREGWEHQNLNARSIAYPAPTWSPARLTVRHVDRPGAVWVSKARIAGYESGWYVSRLNAANKIVG